MKYEFLSEKLEKHLELIEKSINEKFSKYSSALNSYINELFGQFGVIQNEQNRKRQDFISEIKTIKPSKRFSQVNSLCFLKDGRLVSSDDRIVIYRIGTFEPDVIIKINDRDIESVCCLSNGNLASGGKDTIINIWEINGNNYTQLYSLEIHDDAIWKVIELEDGKLCSCSRDKTIKILDNKNNYQCIKTLKGHTGVIISIIEMNNYIISASGYYGDTTVIFWNKYTYDYKTLNNIYSCNSNGLQKLKDNNIIIGGNDKIFIIDGSTFQYKSLTNSDLGWISSVCVLKDDKVLLGNEYGQISCFDVLSYQFIFIGKKIHNDYLSCIIKTEDEQIISSAHDSTINIFKLLC